MKNKLAGINRKKLLALLLAMSIVFSAIATTLSGTFATDYVGYEENDYDVTFERTNNYPLFAKGETKTSPIANYYDWSSGDPAVISVNRSIAKTPDGQTRPTQVILTALKADVASVSLGTKAGVSSTLIYQVYDPANISRYVIREKGIGYIPRSGYEITIPIKTWPANIASTLKWEPLVPSMSSVVEYLGNGKLKAKVNLGMAVFKADIVDTFGIPRTIMYTVNVGGEIDPTNNMARLLALLAVAKENQLSKDIYTNWGTLQMDRLITEGETVVAQGFDAKQADINAKADALEAALNKLVKLDISSIVLPDKLEYTTASWNSSNIQTYYNNLMNILGKTPIDAAAFKTNYDAFEAAKLKLVARGTNDALRQKYNQLNPLKSKEDLSVYSYNALRSALNAIPSGAIATPPPKVDYTQAQIDSYLASLNGVSLVYTSNLWNVIKEANVILNNANSVNIYAPTWIAELRTAVEAGNTLLNRTDNYTQTMATNAYNAIRTLLDNPRYGTVTNFTVTDKSTGKAAVTPLNISTTSSSSTISREFTVTVTGTGTVNYAVWSVTKNTVSGSSVTVPNGDPMSKANTIKITVPQYSAGEITFTVSPYGFPSIVKTFTIVYNTSPTTIVNMLGPSVYHDSSAANYSSATSGLGSYSITAAREGYYSIQAWGANGGRDNGAQHQAGFGGKSSALVYLKSGDVLYYYVGSAGKQGNAVVGTDHKGGYSGGSNGNGGLGKWTGGGGGGATKVWINNTVFNSGTILAVAGGGGGAVDDNNGGNAGANRYSGYGTTGLTPSGTTSSRVAAGNDGGGVGGNAQAAIGRGGSSTGGSGGYINGTFNGTSGSLGRGGDGGYNGGGGGAGYYGGGGGCGNLIGTRAGGGGGSSYVAGYVNGFVLQTLTSRLENASGGLFSLAQDNSTENAHGALKIVYFGKLLPQ